MAGGDEFSMSQQLEMFDYFPKFRIYNCIIVSQEHDIISKEHSSPSKANDVGSGIK